MAAQRIGARAYECMRARRTGWEDHRGFAPRASNDCMVIRRHQVTVPRESIFRRAWVGAGGTRGGAG
eukprot:3753313-Pyramimonas_sp.AAC.1